MDGRELFPRGTVLLHGIKTFGKERIDRAILYAASVLIPSCETLSPVFLNVIQGKKDMLYKTEDIVYEDRMGFSAWADGARVLIGNREMMAAHEIPMPSREYELQYTKTKKRDAIYLAVGGSLYAMFVVSYNLSTDVEASIRRLTDEGLFLVVRTNDFCITRQRISEVYGLPISSVSVLKKADMEAVADELTYKAHSRSIISHIGTLPSYTAGILACRHLLRCLDVTGSGWCWPISLSGWPLILLFQPLRGVDRPRQGGPPLATERGTAGKRGAGSVCAAAESRRSDRAAVEWVGQTALRVRAWSSAPNRSAETGSWKRGG